MAGNRSEARRDPAFPGRGGRFLDQGSILNWSIPSGTEWGDKGKAGMAEQETMEAVDDRIDFEADSKIVDIKLLRALALGNKHSTEIQALIDIYVSQNADFKTLAFLLTDYSVDEENAAVTVRKILDYRGRLQEKLERQVGIKTAALDYLENIEQILGIHNKDQSLTYEQLSRMAFTDHLTGLSNFRYFNIRFEEEIKRAGRYRHLCSLLMIDIDHFKEYNDKMGHPTANLALESFARALTLEVRETDLIGRWGGDEFAVILPETTRNEAITMAERIRDKTRSMVLPARKQGSFSITVSIGVATYPRDARDSKELLSSADRALYLSKQNGRDRVTVHTPYSNATLVYYPEPGFAVESASVVGDFNGWDVKGDPMVRREDGSFGLTVFVVPGVYQYKFYLNNGVYMPDPRCAGFVNDNYGGRNSILVVE